MPTARSVKVLSVVLVMAAAGCGGSSSPAGKAAGPTLGTPNSPEVTALLRKTFGPNGKATSGNISGIIDITVKGLPRYRDPIQISVVGPFTAVGGTPEGMFDLSLGLRGGILGGNLYLKGNDAYIGLGSTAFKIPPSIAAPMRAPLAQHGNALGAILAVFHVAPAHWAKNPRIVGAAQVGGIDTTHATAEIDTRAFLRDVASLADLLTSLGITDISGLPRSIDSAARAALARSVKTATGDVYTGAEDHVLRRAQLNMLIEPSARDRRTLGGFTSIKVSGTLDVTDIGTPQKVTLPASRGSYAQLQTTLNILGKSVR